MAEWGSGALLTHRNFNIFNHFLFFINANHELIKRCKEISENVLLKRGPAQIRLARIGKNFLFIHLYSKSGVKHLDFAHTIGHINC